MLLPLLTVPVTAQKPLSITWSRTYGRLEPPGAVVQTSDGGFVVVGVYDSLWVLKTDALGEPEWEKGYAPDGYYSYFSQVGSVEETHDRGYLVAGSATSFGYSTGVDGWLLKLDHAGNVQWSKTYGGRSDDGFYMAEQTSDGGYVVAGNTASVSSHVFNGWILRLDMSGSVTWQKAYVGEDIHSVDRTSDGGFIVAGTVGVDNRAEAWVFKVDREGNTVWQKAYEVAVRTEAYSVSQTRDGGFIVAGHSSFGALVLRLDPKGNTRWQKTLSGSGFTTSSATETPDRGFIIAGYDTGFFLLKLDAKGNIIWLKNYGARYGFLQSVQLTRYGGFVAVGKLGLNLYFHAWVIRLDLNGSIIGCPLGDSSNATLTDAVTVVTNTNVVPVTANETVNHATVIANVVTEGVQTQCVTIARESKKARET